MIYAFNFTCDRDLELSNLMVRTLYKHCPNVKELVVINSDHNEEYKGYGNGAGWLASMLKLNRLRQFNPADDDFVLSVDSDVVFTSPEVFKYVDPQYGIIGIKHRPEFKTRLGRWSHMSGALIFIRGDIAKKIAALHDQSLANIRFEDFKPFNLTENEDVVLSYLASAVGANQFDLGTVPGLSSGDFESTVFTKFLMTDINGANLLPGGRWASFYHLNYCPTQFLGEPVAGKWDIPRILQTKGIEL